MRLTKQIILANPRGFCAGVDRAIEIVELLLAKHGKPIYVKHEVVHNNFVINNLKDKGAIFIEDVSSVPKGSILVYSAHGVSKAVRVAAENQELVVHDATCPLVSKVHAQVIRLRAAGNEILMIGHKGHPEVEGTMGQISDGIYLIENLEDVDNLIIKDPSKLAYVTQTTLSVDETKEIINKIANKYPQVKHPAKEDICYATQNRQDAVKKIAKDCDLVLVVGSNTSSNSNRLREVANKCGAKAKLIDGAQFIESTWLDDVSNIGVTAGASAPEEIVQDVINKIKELKPEITVEEFAGVKENVTFAVPKELTRVEVTSS